MSGVLAVALLTNCVVYNLHSAAVYSLHIAVMYNLHSAVVYNLHSPVLYNLQNGILEGPFFFFKEETAHKISNLQEKQEDSVVSRER
jgi:hypothetical protein